MSKETTRLHRTESWYLRGVDADYETVANNEKKIDSSYLICMQMQIKTTLSKIKQVVRGTVLNH